MAKKMKVSYSTFDTFQIVIMVFQINFKFLRSDRTEITDEDEESEIEELKKFMKQKVNPWNIRKTLEQINYSECSNGKEWDFKIVSWNINGLRAWLEVKF